MIAAPLEEIERRASLWADALGGMAEVIPGETMVGGGSLPGGTLPTRLVAIGRSGRNTARALGERLRLREVPVIARIDKDTLLLDPRTVLPEEDEIVLNALREIADRLKQVK
jgi:L-seryl-tRNA(Ser) seleniumtransferase